MYFSFSKFKPIRLLSDGRIFFGLNQRPGNSGVYQFAREPHVLVTSITSLNFLDDYAT